MKNTSEISEMCHKSDAPIYITKNGYGDMVIMGMEVYERTMRQLAVYRDVGYREAVMERMNYIIVFSVKEDVVNIVGIFHQLENYQKKL
mgnify:CR=1 FL=1